VVLSPIKKEKMLAIKKNTGFLEGFGFLLLFFPDPEKYCTGSRKMLARAIMDWNRGVERLIRGWERELVAISGKLL
jgi:hypothetical protein